LAITREIICAYAFSFLGLPYVWGGDDAVSGFDCSGLIHELSQAVGLEPRGHDSTAHGMYLSFKETRHTIELHEKQPGDFVFWFKDGKAVHVGLIYNVDPNIVIHAGGGGSGVKTVKDAIKHNAYIRMDELNYRGDNFKIVNPFKYEE
jgi:cell wall-associated NlpC family hydrolase